MLHFENDYNRGACIEILARLAETNFLQQDSYGMDEISESAKKFIKKEIKNELSEIHFLVGGTQANLAVISSALRPHEGVISAASGHINVHETGAIEATGHKVLVTGEGKDGKFTAEEVDKYCKAHFESDGCEHSVKPGMVYISQTTEYGTLYTKSELENLYKVCKSNGLYMFLDGARLGYALSAQSCDMTLADIAANTDVFTIGGTKCGALLGEAVVINSPVLQKDFRYIIKQKGGLLAKGWLLGLQFDTLFTDGLYTKLCRKANTLAMEIKDELTSKGYQLYTQTDANQQFVIMPNKKYNELSEKFVLSPIAPYGENECIIRICTSWATTEDEVKMLKEAL